MGWIEIRSQIQPLLGLCVCSKHFLLEPEQILSLSLPEERERETETERQRDREKEEQEVNRERSEHDYSQKFKIVSPLFTNNNYFLLSARETGGVLY